MSRPRTSPPIRPTTRAGAPTLRRPNARSGAWLLRLALASVALLAGCGGATGGASDPSGSVSVPSVDDRQIHPIDADPTPALPVTVTGADGRTITVADVSRIVSLTGGISEIVYSLNLGDDVVGKDISTTFAAADGVPVVTRAHDVSAESVLSLHPTVVLADSDSGPSEAIEQIRGAGVPVVVFDVATAVDEIRPRILAVAGALGVAAAGATLADRTDDQIDAATQGVPDEAKKLKVAFLYVRGTAGVYLLGGPGSGADSLIEAAGGIDAGTAEGLAKSFTPITSEAMVGAAPDAILVMTAGLDSVGGVDGLASLPGVAQTPAGQHKRVISIEDGVLLNFGPRTAAVIAEISSQLYPPAVSQ
jgi:iron complex transport system substrate-binding protein